ncbi:MAG: cell wall hydrolase [Oscillospiraceae bacterium]|nr:cell wall hydrolase [Oscillospiraceae bacterium]
MRTYISGFAVIIITIYALWFNLISTVFAADIATLAEKAYKTAPSVKVTSYGDSNVFKSDPTPDDISPDLDYLSVPGYSSPVDAYVEDSVMCGSICISEDELRMLYCVVQREVDNLGLEHKRIIAEVIINRVKSDKFPNTVSDVLHQKKQYPTIINFYNTTFVPDETTIQAVNDVINGRCEDRSCGALYFYDPEYTSDEVAAWFESDLCYLYTIDCHRFFKDK